jgi:arginine repressor
MSSNGLGKPAERIEPTDAQIQAHALNADGTIRTYKATISALHDNGFIASKHSIAEQRRLLVSSGRGRPTERKTATDQQILDYSRNTDGSMRNHREIESALHNDGFSLKYSRISKQLRSIGLGKPQRTSATDAQILDYSRNTDGSVRTREQIASAMRNDGLGIRDSRITTQLQLIRSPTQSAHASQHDNSTMHALIDE